MRIEVSLFRYISDHALKAGEIVIDALTFVQDLSIRGLDQASQHLDRSALAGAIGPKISKDFARRDKEANLANCRNVIVVLGQTAGLEHALFLPTAFDTAKLRFVSR